MEGIERINITMGDVHYGLREADAMPKRSYGGTRTSELQEMVKAIQGDHEAHGKVFLIADYGKSEGASAAAQNLRNKNGWNPTHNGWDFKVGRVEDDLGDIRHGLYACYTPGKIVPGAWDQEKANRAAKKALKSVQVEVEVEVDSRTPIERLTA